jgi:NADPH2:quinone reductase
MASPLMRAVRLDRAGGPEVLAVTDIEVPEPGTGQVRVRHHAIGLNFIDIYFRQGDYPAPLPFTPGNEGAGEVVALGLGVEDVKIGDRVAYVSTLGSYAEERNVEARALIKLPKSISCEMGAAMMLKGLTAQYLLRRTFKVKEGDTILVHAAAGGVGLLLCQWG